MAKRKYKKVKKGRLLPHPFVEIARSFSYKHNLGNYQSADFFCSQKAEVPVKDAEKTSEALYQFCKDQVTKSLNEYLKTGIEKYEPTLKELVHDYAKKEGIKVYEAKETDPWRQDTSPKYRAKDKEGTKELIEKEYSKPY